VNIMWKLLHSAQALLSQFEWNVIQGTLCEFYCTLCRQLCFRLNGVVKVTITWNLLHSR